MKILSTIVAFFFVALSSAQLKAGFNIEEVKNTIAMCNSFNFTEQYGTNKAIIPTGFQMDYTSEIIGMDNKFEVYQDGKMGIINYRGSTNNFMSWVENFYSAMIPAQGTIKIEDTSYEYAFAKKDNAAVHAGYGLTVVLLSDKIKEQVNKLNNKGVYNILITGHSQGGALATMTRSYLENLPKGEVSDKNKFKTYAFAQPMSGNKEFADEYNKRFSETGFSYSLINLKDPVPHLPFNYEEDKLISKDKIKGWIFGESDFEAKKLGQSAFIRLFEKGLTKYIKSSNALINKLVDFKIGNIELPEYVSDINYYPTGIEKELPEFKYPKIEVEVSGLTEEELENYEKGTDGKWYKKEKRFFQHKAYNYYVYVLKEWDREAYENLEMTYLESDL